MALLRVVHASQLPDPGEMARRLVAGEGLPTAPATPAPAPAAPEKAALPASYEAMIDRLEGAGRRIMADALRSDFRLVRYAAPELRVQAVRATAADKLIDLAKMLREVTGEPWDVALGEGPAEPSLVEREQAAEQAARDAILSTPIVQATMAAFPEADPIWDEDERRSA